ncbi:MAG: MerR family transcriptional regulator [Candidatus Aminicenantes bacterium]|nr:MerR family transcriptional regulator [Candidatus Aminicenantes bacterium]
MDFQLPDKLTFKKKEVINITRLDGKVIDYWEKEFGGFSPVVNNIGEKFYTRRDLELLLKIKQLLIIEKMEKDQVKTVMKNEFQLHPDSFSGIPAREIKSDKLKSIKNQLKEILTILDKNDKR